MLHQPLHKVLLLFVSTLRQTLSFTSHITLWNLSFASIKCHLRTFPCVAFSSQALLFLIHFPPIKRKRTYIVNSHTRSVFFINTFEISSWQEYFVTLRFLIFSLFISAKCFLLKRNKCENLPIRSSFMFILWCSCFLYSGNFKGWVRLEIYRIKSWANFSRALESLKGENHNLKCWKFTKLQNATKEFILEKLICYINSTSAGMKIALGTNEQKLAENVQKAQKAHNDAC